jgi:exodeoxyribonuclease VII large subunit
LMQAAKGLQSARQQRLNQASALLGSFSYQRVLERGFALVSDSGRNAVASAGNVKPGTGLSIQFHDGEVFATASGKPVGNPGGKPKPRKGKKHDDGNQGSLL